MLRCTPHEPVSAGKLAMGLSVVLLLLAHHAAAQDCSRMYRQGGKPLLFGGITEPGRCVSDCQSRDSFW